MESSFYRHATVASIALTMALVSHVAHAADNQFTIKRFDIVGNRLLSQSDIDAAVSASVGPDKTFGSIQKALEALEAAYRSRGFSAVRVSVPEQELTSGVVRIEVVESTIDKVVVSGNSYFDTANIRASLPPLQEGQTPNLQKISAAIQLANENFAKQVEVTLASTDIDGRVDAKVAVTDSKPFHVTATLDNSGTKSSGKYRTGVALQYANFFGRDQVGTLAYTTSPDSPSGVHVDLFSIGYRIPLYALGDSIDLIYGTSSVNSPSGSPTLGGILGIVGKGSVAGLRWNHLLARRGEFTSKIVTSLDRKYINSRCSVNGVEISFAPPTPPISACVPYTVMPLAVTYSGRHQSAGQLLDASIGIERNLATGTAYTNVTGRNDRYSYLTPGNRDTRDNFTVLHASTSWFKVYANDWQTRVAVSAQVASDPLVSAEQFGLVGATAVRGFSERAVAADGGTIVNAELYTPDMAGKLGVLGVLRMLAFYDFGRGYNRNVGNAAASSVPSHVSVSSAGVGLRYSIGRDLDVRADVARVNNPGNSTTESRGVWKAHIAIVVGI